MFKFFTKIVFLVTLIFTITACAPDDETMSTEITKPKKPVVILVFGDSISQGYGINIYGDYIQQVTPGNTYTELLRNRVKTEKLDEFASVTVYNDSLGGETAMEATGRLQGVLAYYSPTHVVLAHGTNDAASNVALSTISSHFNNMINIAKGNGVKVLLADIPLNVRGADYAAQYSAMIKNTAVSQAVTYVPLLKGVTFNSTYYHPDGVHPKDSAQNLMQNNLWEAWLPTLN
jgi:lysophospholipase L1-like esterase